MTQPLTTASWHRFVPGVLLLVAVLLLFRDTALAMVSIWERSQTYAHAYLVLPISIWLAWRQRDRLVGLPVRPAPWVLLPMAAVCVAWLVGDLAAAQAPTQFALVTLLVLCVPAAFGLQITRALLFPLLFLYFAVPVGEFMVPTMMEWTADITIAAVRASGVPVYREGFQFILPTGSWSVVDACSGVRYLIASFMVGTLFAYINYQSTKRRAIFVLLSVLVPVLANWFRAYFIVMLGHLSNNQLAAGVDHIIYGWVFFGIVIGLMFFIGARWAEHDHPGAAPSAARGADIGRQGAGGAAAWVVGGLALLLLGSTQAFAWRLNHAQSAAPQLTLPAALGGGWTAAAPMPTAWKPVFKGTRTTAGTTYRLGNEEAAVWVGYYRDQSYESKLVASTNVLAESHGDSLWAQAERGSRSVATAQGSLQVRSADVQAALARGGGSAQRLRAWQVYWVDGEFIASDTQTRLRLAVNRLLGRGDDAAVVVFYTDTHAQGDADERLGRFVAAGLQPLAAQLETTRAGR